MCLEGQQGGMSDHYLLEAKIQMRGYIIRGGSGVRMNQRVIKIEELEKLEKREAYVNLLEREWARVRNRRWCSMNEEWEIFKKSVLGSAAKVCGYKRVGRKNERSAWWDEEVKRLVKEKKRLFEAVLAERSERNVEEYKRMKRQVKRVVREKKNALDERDGEKMSRQFRENKKLFWSSVNKKRSTREQMSMRVKDSEGNLLVEQGAVSKRWKEYFQGLLNVDTGRGAQLLDVRNENGNDLVGFEIEVDDVELALKKLKKGKSPGVDGIKSEMLKYGGDAMLEWLTRVCKVCMASERVPRDWVRAIMVPFYKGKGDRNDCRSYRGISLLSIPGKVYGRILIERVRALTEGRMGEEQCGFRRGRGCVDQIYVMKQMSEKYWERNKSLYVAYMDLEKAYDRVDREAMWQVLGMYGINGSLLNCIKSLYEQSEACVRVYRRDSEWFGVGEGLRQGCVMSPWLFNLFMDGVMNEVRRSVGDMGAMMWDSRRNTEWNVEWLMFADDTVLLGDSEEKLERLVQEFSRVCSRWKLSVNESKSKVMKVGRNGGENRVNVNLNRKRMEEVHAYRYLGVDITNESGMSEELVHRIGEARKTWGALSDVWQKRNMSREAKMGMYEGIIQPSLLYGSEVWVLNKRERKKMQAVEMSCLRNICGTRRNDRVRNEEIRRRCGNKVSIEQKMDQSILRWFGHVERMGNERMVRRVYDSEVRGVRARGRPKKTWEKEVEQCLRRKSFSLQEAKVIVHNRDEWRTLCKGNIRRAQMGGVSGNAGT